MLQFWRNVLQYSYQISHRVSIINLIYKWNIAWYVLLKCSDAVQTMFIMNRLCSDFSDNVQNAQTFQTMFRMSRLCLNNVQTLFRLFQNFQNVQTVQTFSEFSVLFRISWLYLQRERRNWQNENCISNF